MMRVEHALAVMIFPAALSLWPAPAPAQLRTAEPPICTDRPTRANVACTVPAGRVQIESDVSAWTMMRGGGDRTDVVAPLNPVVKLGLDDATDVEANFPPLLLVRTRNAGGVERRRGIGDLTLRIKHRLTAANTNAQVALIPFVKAPIAKRGIGNRRWEGGLVVPVQFNLPEQTTLTFGPEIDLLADADGRGRHVQLVGLVNLSRALTPRLTAYAELWTAQNYDPAATVRQHSADAALAYLLTPTLQIDMGANIGLNRVTPDMQVYAGISTRF